MSNLHLLAVDLGASGGKCFAAEVGADVLQMKEIHRFAHEAVACYARERNGAVTERLYWDDLCLYRNIIEGLYRYRREIGSRLDGLAIDTWGADGVFVTADGDLLGKVYCYRDHRLDEMIAAVKQRIDPRRIYEITGIHFQPFNVSNQLRWVVVNRPHWFQIGARYLPIPTLFNFYLGGAQEVDSTWASVTQLMDARTRQWSREILDKLEIPATILPKIVPPGTVLGELWPALARATGLNGTRLVAVAAHDTASAFAAAPVDDPATALIISSGTWSIVGRLVPEPLTSPAAMAANFSNEGGIGNTRFLKNCMGTWLVQELRRVWRLADGHELDWTEITAMAERSAPFVTLLDPDNPGFYNPANMEEAIADFCRRTDQPVPDGRGAFVRSVYESLALKYRYVYEQMSRVCGRGCQSVNIVGGGSRNALLCQFTADALGLPVLAGPEEATALGNLMVQALALRQIGSLEAMQPLIRRVFSIREYRPVQTAKWEAAYERFLRLLSASAGR